MMTMFRHRVARAVALCGHGLAVTAGLPGQDDSQQARRLLEMLDDCHTRATKDQPGPDDKRVLWESIDDDELRELWQLVVQQVRSEQSEVRVTFRCDSARARRWFEMAVSPVADGGVRFRSVLVFQEARSPVALLDPTIERDHASEPIALCSWCGRGRFDGSWLDIERLVADARLLERESLPPLTSGICGSCREQMSAELLAQGVAVS